MRHSSNALRSLPSNVQRSVCSCERLLDCCPYQSRDAKVWLLHESVPRPPAATGAPDAVDIRFNYASEALTRTWSGYCCIYHALVDACGPARPGVHWLPLTTLCLHCRPCWHVIHQTRNSTNCPLARKTPFTRCNSSSSSALNDVYEENISARIDTDTDIFTDTS